MSAAPADLRAAALSDLRHPSSTGRLHILLPDVPGEPFGGTATPVPSAKPPPRPPGSLFRPSCSRGRPPARTTCVALMRAWAASQPRPTPGSLREQIADLLQDNIPGFYPDHLRAADALLERYAVASRGKDNATGLRTAIQTLQGPDEQQPAVPGPTSTD